MDLPQLKSNKKLEDVSEFTETKLIVEKNNSKQIIKNEVSVGVEAEIPEELYKGMKEFIGTNPQWDQYRLMSSALANFLFQNGSQDRAVTERYLNDLFNLVDS